MRFVDVIGLGRLALAVALLWALGGCATDADPDEQRRFKDNESAEAICVEATDAERCGELRFDLGSQIDDGWARCTWVDFHEAAADGDACTYGEVISECHLAIGGEEDRSLLITVCGPPYEDVQSVYTLERDGRQYVSFAANYLPALQPDVCRFERGRAVNSPAVCDCPCRPGFPNTACLVGPGYEECPAVPFHRIEAVACEDASGPCVTDDDCAPGDACVCKVGPIYETSCVSATCATDADCAEGEVCAVSWGRSSDGLQRVEALACRRAFEHCDGETWCSCAEACRVDLDTERWSCDLDAC